MDEPPFFKLIFIVVIKVMGVLINVRGENMYIKKFNRINLSGNEQYLEVLRALEDRAEYIEIRHNNEEVSESFSNYLRYLEENITR